MKFNTYIQKTYGEYYVHFNIGNQYFSLAPGWPGKKSAKWMENRLKIALNNLRNGK